MNEVIVVVVSVQCFDQTRARKRNQVSEGIHRSSIIRKRYKQILTNLIPTSAAPVAKGIALVALGAVCG